MSDFLKTKKAEVLNHWYTPVPHYTAPPGDFYTAVERQLAAEKVPGLTISRVDFSEGGLLSDKRQYLRMTRERLVFDVCAAPFGTNFFYSCRFAEIPAVVQFWELLLLIVCLGFAASASFSALVETVGWIMALFVWPLAWLAFIVFAIYAMRNAASIGIKDFDQTLLQVPIINSVYAAWFRKETYYREDTRLMYLTIVEGVVKRLVEQETAAKGITLLKAYERSPILGDLYKLTCKTQEKPPEQAPPPLPA